MQAILSETNGLEGHLPRKPTPGTNLAQAGSDQKNGLCKEDRMKSNFGLRKLGLGVLAVSVLSTINANAEFDLFGIFKREPRRERRQQPRDPWARQRTLDPLSQDLDLANQAPVLSDAKAQEQAIINEFRNQRPSGQRIAVTQREWSEEAENLFGMFVEQLGNAVRDGVCGTVKECIRNPRANMFARDDAPSLIMYSDCADFPYFLRAYFAAHAGLPFSYVSGLKLLQAPVASEANRQDDLAQSLIDGRLDNSPYGNVATGRYGSNVAAKAGQGAMIENYMEQMFDNVSTRTFRAGPMNRNLVTLDTYPVRINKEGIRTGTLVHNTGHLGVIFDIDSSGNLTMVDAHPDGSVSIKMIKPSTLDRSRPDHGLGFYRFRNQRAVGGKENWASGEITGAKVVPVSDEELLASGAYSLEQYFGIGSNVRPDSNVSPVAWKQAFADGEFFNTLSSNLRGVGVWIDADQAVVKLMDSLCSEMKQRVADVDVALNAGTPNSAHPSTLPPNIFNTSGTWEDQSTPGRDGRMRAAVGDIARAAVGQWQLVKAKGTGVRFKGGDKVAYRNALLNALNEMDQKCQITYRKSNGGRKTLAFSQILNRLNKMSFDPYHCSEKRWGASGEEMSSCEDSDSGDRWYTAQTKMRNYQGKILHNEKLVIRSTRPITLEMLQSGDFDDQGDDAQINLGYSRAPLMNLEGLMSSDRFMDALDSGRL